MISGTRGGASFKGLRSNRQVHDRQPLVNSIEEKHSWKQRRVSR